MHKCTRCGARFEDFDQDFFKPRSLCDRCWNIRVRYVAAGVIVLVIAVGIFITKF